MDASENVYFKNFIAINTQMTSIAQINHLLSTSYVPDTMLTAEDKKIN